MKMFDNDNFMNSLLDTITDNDDENETKEKVAALLAAKRNPQLTLKRVTNKIEKTFEKRIVDIIKANVNQGSVLIELLTQTSIAADIKNIQSSDLLRQLSGMDKLKYDKLIEDIADEIINKYLR